MPLCSTGGISPTNPFEGTVSPFVPVCEILKILKPGSLRPSHCSCLAEHLQKKTITSLARTSGFSSAKWVTAQAIPSSS